MKRLNIKLALWLLGTTLVLVVGVHFLHGFQLDRNADFLRLQAEQAQASGDRDGAIKSYNQFLKYRDDPDAFKALAALVADTAKEAEATTKDKLLAYNVLEEAVRRHPELDEVRRRLVDVTIMVRRFSESLDHIKYLNDNGDNDPAFEFKKARCYIEMGEGDKAVKKLHEIVGFDEATEKFTDKPATTPNQIEAFELLADILRRRPDGAKQAGEVMDRLVELHPDSSKARLARANFKSATDGISAAKEDLERSAKLAPNDPDVLLATAVFAISEKQYPQAQEILDRALASFPKRADVYVRLAQLAGAQNDFKRATEYLLQGVEKATDVQTILPMLLELQLQTKDLKAAQATCKDLEQRGTFRPEFIRYSRARVKFAEENYWEASRELESVRPAIARAPVFATTYLSQLDFLLSKCYESLGLYDRQLDVARRVLQSEPTQVAARLSEVTALQSLARYDEAATGLAMLANNSEKLPMLRGETVRLLTIDQLRRPKDQRDWSMVDKLAGSLYTDGARSAVENEILKAEMLMAQDRLEDAQAILLGARKQDPKDRRVWTALANLLARQNRLDSLEQLLDIAEKEVGDALPLRLERVRLIARKGGDSAGADLQKMEQAAEKLPEDERLALMVQIGVAYLQLRQFDGSKRCWKYAVEHDANNSQIRQILFELMSDTKDVAGMEATLKGIHDSPNWGPQSPLYKYCKAMLLLYPLAQGNARDAASWSEADRKALAEARRLISEAKTIRVQWGVLWRVQGEIEQLEGDPEAAIASYQTALECSQSGQTVVARRLVQLLYAMHRYDEADKALKYVGEMSAADPLQKVARDIDVETGDISGGLEGARHDAEADPKNPVNHIFYGRLLEKAGHIAEAEQAYRKAVEVGPNLPQTWQLLVRSLVANKKQAEAVQAVGEATTTLADQPAILAQLYELAGDRQQAEQFYQKAIDAKPEDRIALQQMVRFHFKSGQSGPPDQLIPQLKKAEPYITKVIQQASSATDADAARHLAWAHRAQAEVLAAHGDYDHSLAAVKEIEKNARKGKLSADDLGAMVAVLSRRPEPDSRAKSLKLLSQLRDVRPLQPREELVMGQLYDRAGNWSEARTLMSNSLSRQPNDPETLVAFIRALVMHDEYGEAAQWLDQLDKLLPTLPPAAMATFKPASLELRARLLVKTGKAPEAVAVLEQLIPRPLPPNQLNRLSEVARLLEQLGQFDAAKKLLDEYVQQEPRSATAMAGFFGRRGDLDKAFQLLDEARKKQGMVEIIACANEALRLHPDQATPERFRTLEGWANTALESDAQATDIKLLLAELYDMQGRYADVIKIYRELLAAPNTTPVLAAKVKNNLAFVLAITKENAPEALKLIGESISVMGPSSDLLDTRGIAHLSQGDVKQAVADLRMSVTDEPSMNKYFHLAQAEKEANNLTAAREALAQAKQLGIDPVGMTPLERKGYEQLAAELR